MALVNSKLLWQFMPCHTIQHRIIPYLKKNVAYLYCKEGTEMRQLVFRSTDVYCQNLNNLNLHNIVIFILERKEGKKGQRPERHRERVCERQSVTENVVGVCSKTAIGRRINYFESSENQHIKITFFLGNYFNGRRRSEKIH